MQTKLEPAPLKYPNGGGLNTMASKPKSQELEIDALLAKHKVEIAKLKEKHAAANTPKVKAKVPKAKAKTSVKNV